MGLTTRTRNGFRASDLRLLMATAVWTISLTAAVTRGPVAAGDEPRGEGTAAESAPAAKDAAPFEVIFLDQSTLKLAVEREQIDLATPYGKLTIPFGDIRRIDFGRRVPSVEARKIDAAIADLGSPQFRRREEAEAELLAHGSRSLSAVMRATKSKDAEIAARASALLEKLRQRVPEELLELPEFDVVYTKDSKIVGRIEGEESWKARTSQFGDVRLKLADMRRLRLRASDEDPDLANAAPGPDTLMGVAAEVGKTFIYRVKGSTDGLIWGSDIYTVDSPLATAAVHAGILRPGQVGAVRVEIVGVQLMYRGSERNGVMSHAFLSYPGFRFVKRKAE